MDDNENLEHVMPDPREHERDSQNVESVPVTAEPVKHILAALGLVAPLPVSAEKSQEELAAALQASERATRVAAVRALGRRRGAESLALLQMALRDADKAVRGAAVRAIGAYKEDVPIDVLLESLSDPDWYVRACAVHELGGQIERVSVAPLIEAMHDEDESVRAEAVWALGLLGARAPEGLRDVLHDPSRLVREAVAQVMAQRIERIVNDAVSGECMELAELLTSESAEPLQAAYELPDGASVLPDELPRGHANGRLPDTGPLARLEHLAEVAKHEQSHARGSQPAPRHAQTSQARTRRNERASGVARRRGSHLLERALLAILILGFGLIWYSLDQRFHQGSVATQGNLSCVFHPGRNGDGNVMAWSPGKSTDVSGLFAVAGAGGNVVVYTANSCRYVTVYKEGNGSTILALKWIASGLRIAFLDQHGFLQIVQAQEHGGSEQLLTIPGPAQAGVRPLVAWSDDGQHLAVNWGDNLLDVWSVQEKAAIARYTAPDGQISALAWSPQSTEIAAAAFDGRSGNALIQIWSVITERTVAQDIYPSAEVMAMAWSGDGQNLLFYNQNNVIYRWNRVTQEANSTNTNYASLPQTVNFALALAWAPDNTRFVMASANNLQIWNAITNQSVMSIPNEFTQINRLSWSPDGLHIAAAGPDGTVQLWKVSG